MKFLSIVFLCALATAVKAAKTEEAMQAMRAIAVDCLKEIGAGDDVFDEMIKNQPATNKEVKCLRACIMMKVNVLTPEGKLDKENALKMAEMHTEGNMEKIQIAKDLIDKCHATSVPDDHCEAAEMYKMCILSEVKKHGVDNLM